MLNVWVACPPKAYSASLELHSLDLLKQLNILHSSADGLEVNFPIQFQFPVVGHENLRQQHASVVVFALSC